MVETGSVRFRQVSAKGRTQFVQMVYTAYLTLRPILSIGWLPSLVCYDDSMGGEIKASNIGVGDYESVQVQVMLPVRGVRKSASLLVGVTKFLFLWEFLVKPSPMGH